MRRQRVKVKSSHEFYPDVEGEYDATTEDGLVVIKIREIRGCDQLIAVGYNDTEWLPDPPAPAVPGKTLYAYEFGFPGMALGGTAVVLAETQANGEALLREYMSKLPEFTGKWRKLDIHLAVEPPRLGAEGIVYFDNGDY